MRELLRLKMYGMIWVGIRSDFSNFPKNTHVLTEIPRVSRVPGHPACHDFFDFVKIKFILRFAIL